VRDLHLRVRKSLAENGIAATVERAVLYCLRRAAYLRPATHRARRARAESERRFDEHYGVRTSEVGEVRPDDVLGTRWMGGRRHMALDPRFDFEAALAGLEVPLESSVFVDVGAGMGRALFLAARLPFKRMIGVEYSAELVAIARANLIRSSAPDVREREIEIVHADAVEFELPAEPLVLFIFNPFTCSVMAEFVDHVRTSFLTIPRRMVVVYHTAICGELWDSAGFVRYVRFSQGARVYDTLGADDSTGARSMISRKGAIGPVYAPDARGGSSPRPGP
jgi:SAM-dependent methyltransferase